MILIPKLRKQRLSGGLLLPYNMCYTLTLAGKMKPKFWGWRRTHTHTHTCSFRYLPIHFWTLHQEQKRRREKGSSKIRKKSWSTLGECQIRFQFQLASNSCSIPLEVNWISGQCHTRPGQERKKRISVVRRPENNGTSPSPTIFFWPNPISRRTIWWLVGQQRMADEPSDGPIWS